MAVSASAVAQSADLGISGNGKGVDILGQGIFETGGSAFKTPAHADTNFDSVDVGNDAALAIGAGAWGPGPAGAVNNGNVQALNDLEIKKNQDSGACAPCQALDSNGACQDACTKYNIEQIRVGSRNAIAIGAGAWGPGSASLNAGGIVASNTVKIVTNQQ
jgi:hypothetical protein